MKYGIQIASICFFLIILFNFIRHKRLPLISSRIFFAFLVVAGINLIFEGLTLYTITNMTNTLFNRICHQFFIGTIDIIIFLMYYYIDIKTRYNHKYNKFDLIKIIPLIVSIVVTMFFKIYYYVGEDGFYSYGPMANTIFFSVPIYVILALYDLFKFKDVFNKDSRINIIIGLSFWIIISLIQFIIPTFLLSSLGIVIMVYFIYISYENTDKYIIDNKQIFNINAMYKLIEEYYKIDRTFSIIKLYSSDSFNNDIIKELSKITNGRFFEYNNLELCIFIVNKEDVNNLYINIDKCFKKKLISKENYDNSCDLIKDLNSKEDYLICKLNNISYKIEYTNIYYIEGLEHSTFVYTINNTYEINDKLYKLEITFSDTSFIRISKSVIVNLEKIKSINNLENSKLEVILDNNEVVTVSRKYLKNFKNMINK